MTNEIPVSRKWLPQGTLLNGRYEIKGRLGDGGFSNTYLAVHRDMKNEVAIKEFYCGDYMYRDCRISNDIILADPGDGERRDKDLGSFLSEARILASLNDVEGIVRVTDYFLENGTAYIVMDQVRGISLEQQLAGGIKYSWDDILKKMLPVMEALSRVHSKKLIHRDIKPANIIITEDGSLKLIDFGAALHYTDEETHSVYLTEGYAPREQYLRSGHLGAFTDIYALCAVIYRCLTGCIPENSLQRAVFDELKSPSEEGIRLPAKFEQILMKGLEINPESRWQTMDEMLAAFRDCLPKPPRGIKPLYVIAGALAVSALLFALFFGRYYREFKMQQLSSRGELVEFDLLPPESMTAQEFSQAVDTVKKRAGIFAGKNGFLMDTYPDRIHLRIPSDTFTAAAPAEKGTPGWTTKTQLDVLFCFSGKWRFHSADLSHIKDISTDHFQSAELKYGSIPILSTSWDSLYTGDEIDWSQKEVYYVEILLDDETAAFLEPEIHEEGFLFMPIPHVEGEIYILPWISKGDGKTLYYPVGSSDCKNVAETMLQIFTQAPFSDSLLLAPTDQGSSGQKTGYGKPLSAEMTEGMTVTVSAQALKAREQEAASEFCKNQLDLLEIPYSMWEEGLITYLQVPADRINSLVLYSLFQNYCRITDMWNAYLMGSDEFTDIQSEEHGGKTYLSIYINRDSLDRRYAAQLQPYRDRETEDPLYLTMADTRIGILDSIDWEEGCFSFKLYLPEDGEDVIPRDRMTDYICRYIKEGSEVNTFYTYMNEWKDVEGNSVTGSSIPKLSPGLSTDRFSGLFSYIEELGGRAEFSTDWLDEKIKITFDHWNGNFPEEALKMIEEIYRENGLDRSICPEIDFEVRSFVKGRPASLRASFSPNESLQSLRCWGGYVDASDESLLERAKAYVEESPLLFTPETETDQFIVPGSDWTYVAID